MLAVHAFAVNVPFTDEWRYAGTIVHDRAGTLTWAELWRPEYEHRIIVPTLIVIWLSWFGGWNTVVECYAGFVIALGTLAVVYRLMVRTLPRRTLLPAFAAASALLFSLGQLDNWVWGFEFSWFSVNLYAFIVASLLSAERLEPSKLGFAMVAATLAAFSLGTGLAVFVLGAVLLAVRAPYAGRTLVLWLALFALVAQLYVHGVPRVAVPQPELADRSLARQFLFLSILLAAPVLLWTSNFVALVGGGIVALSASSLALASFARDLVRKNAERLRGDAPWVALLLYVLVNAALIDAGRSYLALSGATTARYITLTGVLWIALLALAWRRLPIVATSRIAQDRVVLGVLSLAVAGVALQDAWAVPRLKADRVALQGEKALILAAGTGSDAALTRALFPDPHGRAMVALLGDPPLREIPGIIRGLRLYRQGPFAPSDRWMERNP